MRAVRCTESGVALTEIAQPSGDGIRVLIRSAGICGTDLTLVKSGPLPFTLGHEIAGVLDDGTTVAIEPLLPCGCCESCRRGLYHLCDYSIVRLMGVGSDGGMCDEIVVPPRCLVRLPEGLLADDACLVEPMAVALHALRLGGAKAGHRVAIWGAGAIGLCTLCAAKASDCDVRVNARHQSQRLAAEKLGATSFHGACDMAVVAAGNEAALHGAIGDCRPGGTIIVVGTFWENVCFPGVVAMTKELTIHSSFAYGHNGSLRDIEAAAKLLAKQPEIVETLITHRFPLDRAAEAFRVAADRGAGAIKVSLMP